ncbi:MAG: glucuronate isomerase, partial [Gammaproteobacteria bacterium]
MGGFLAEDFLLGSEAARRLYFDHAMDEPIYDYHSHLDPRWIASDHRFDNLTEIWLDGDHYKWRAMRVAGISEELITGMADPRARFLAFASVVPQCIGNPIYHWVHMELRKPFGIETLLDASTADTIWKLGRERLAETQFSARGLLEQFDVRMIGTTDDPADPLDNHASIASDPDFDIAVLPTWRPDILFKPERDDFVDWIETLAEAADTSIRNYADLLEALTRRLDDFDAHGCVSADHGFDHLTFTGNAGAPETVFQSRLEGNRPGSEELVSWRSALAIWLGKQYAARGWVMQLHIGAQRDNNSRMLEQLGPNSGFDSIGDTNYAEPLAAFLDALDREASLPRTILYGLNPRDNEMLATMAGNFPGDGEPAKIQ